MKKIAVFTALSMLAASSAFALEITSAGTSIGGGLYKPSNGVSVKVFTNGTASAMDGTAYAAGSANVKGKKEYATNNTDPKLYSKDAATAGTSSITVSTWTADNSWTAQ
ncbi:hypothetical protein [Geobacter sp. SVR]|uniref:hypothetical protein n=1 Tax=Geobacter sp. SVR TaxID=2495594 RepID=UPI00143EF54A|nr:hypothetical protein [Geobacter sp. SVR]BCS53795.1 hypothetical protein GSVR_21030 [Geobacter sp. SVR]GCF85696.1 hypothetical protein GSbR_22960 [Geobacter sp. SVR]